MLHLSNKAYDTLKWVTSIAFPAVTTLYLTLSQIWNWSGSEKVVLTLGAITTCLGVLIKFSSKQYNKEVEDLFSSFEPPGDA